MTISKENEIRIHERLTTLECKIDDMSDKLDEMARLQKCMPTLTHCSRIQGIYNKLHTIQSLVILGILIFVFTGSLFLPIPLKKIDLPNRTEVQK